MNLFERFNLWIQNTEYSWANTVSFITPWLAPLIPMYISFNHMVLYLDFPLQIAIPSATVVEFLGFATISTSIMFWNHNRRYTNKKNQVPFWVPALSFFFYLGIILSVNVLLELNQGENAKVLAKAMLTLLSIPGAVTIGVRSMYRDVKDGLKRKPKNNRKVTVQEQEDTGKLPVINDWRKVPHEDRLVIAQLSPTEVHQQYGVSKRTARNWLPKAKVYAQEWVYEEK